MAAGPSKEEKTEQPTSKRLSEAREDGNLPSSEELLSAITLIVLTCAMVLVGPRFLEWATSEMRLAFSCRGDYVADPTAFSAFIQSRVISATFVLSPFLLALMISGVASHIAIRGWNFSTKAIKLKFSSLNPITGVKNLFSPESLMKLATSVVKMIFVALVAWFYIRSQIDSLATYQWAWTGELLVAISQLILGVLIRLCIGLLIIGIVDLFYQKWRYTQKLMMTKVEVKDEMKNQEGPPEIKNRIRKKQFELAVRRMLQDVPKANVVIVNPTHVAVALQYDAGTMASPIVVAKGGDHLCEKIKEIARAYGVPIIRRPELARNMYSTVEIGHPIPEPLFVAVAEVLALIWRLRQRK